MSEPKPTPRVSDLIVQDGAWKQYFFNSCQGDCNGAAGLKSTELERGYCSALLCSDTLHHVALRPGEFPGREERMRTTSTVKPMPERQELKGQHD